MDDALAVRVVERRRDLRDDLLGHADRHRTLFLDDGVQRPAGDELHHEVEEPVFPADGVDGDDVYVGQARRGLRFLLEALHHPLVVLEVAGQVRRHDLDRDVAIQREVAGAVHDGHPAPSQLVLDLVLSGRRIAQRAKHRRLELLAQRDGQRGLHGVQLTLHAGDVLAAVRAEPVAGADGLAAAGADALSHGSSSGNRERDA